MPLRFGFVSTYPPTLCGLATFTAALYAELVTDGPDQGAVIRLTEALLPSGLPEESCQLVSGDPAALSGAATQLNRCDVVILQHEYGVYGGPDGDEVLDLLTALSVPVIVVLHTVLEHPTAHQRQVLEAVVRKATAVVTMTTTARGRLAGGYEANMSKVSVIPHGAAPAPAVHVLSAASATTTILTWGLIGPGKGIQWGIEAMAGLADLDVRFVVAGQTHPKVLAFEGERYRERLQGQIHALGLETTVTLDGRYRTTAELAALVDAASIVLLPYDSTDQVTSGVLIEAVAARKPVVATRFPHAVELLGGGAGLLVPHKDPAAISAALRTLVTHQDVAAGMIEVAAEGVPDVLWPAVALHYRELAQALVSARVAA